MVIVWGILNDVDEDDLVAQVRAQITVNGDDDSLKRKIYRQRVTNVPHWDDINQEKFVGLPVNQIPQRRARMDQVIQNTVNDAWNEPTVIKVIIVQEDYNPIEMDYIHDIFQVDSAVISKKVKIVKKPKHPEQPYIWQFGIDKLKVQEFVQAWLNLER